MHDHAQNVGETLINEACFKSRIPPAEIRGAGGSRLQYSSDDGKETVTDDKTGETFSYTCSKKDEDGTLSIEADGYGKAMSVEMTVANWMLLEELGKALNL